MQAIFFTLINEYTDWTRSTEHPINLIDSLIELLGDALTVAPLIEALDHHYLYSLINYLAKVGHSGPIPDSGGGGGDANNLHSHPFGRMSMPAGAATSAANSFFYVFSHQVDCFLVKLANYKKKSYFTPQQNIDSAKNRYHERLGCAHGEELPYLLAIPLLGSLQTTNLYSSLANCDDDNHRAMEKRDSHHYPTLDISPNLFSANAESTFFAPSASATSSLLNFTTADVHLSKLMISYWIHFATYGYVGCVK